MPKTPIQEAFYKRQFSFYCLCIVDAEAKKPVFYIWTEELASRRANEVSSALFHFLKSISIECAEIKRIRLFCDGCREQNRNNPLIHTLMYYLGTAKNSTEDIVVTFPVRGHSFLPADRVFGGVEKQLRKKPSIATKEEYYDVYKSVGEVRKLGETWSLMDSKSLGIRFRAIEHISEKKTNFYKKGTIYD